MSILSDEQMQTTRQFIFQNGRLLERQLFEFFFGKGTKQACVRALLAYQNADGGFGNGVEPDLLCPDSTAIGAETAMFVTDARFGCAAICVACSATARPEVGICAIL